MIMNTIREIGVLKQAEEEDNKHKNHVIHQEKTDVGLECTQGMCLYLLLLRRKKSVWSRISSFAEQMLELHAADTVQSIASPSTDDEAYGHCVNDLWKSIEVFSDALLGIPDDILEGSAAKKKCCKPSFGFVDDA